MIALQAYLRRTLDDVRALLPLAPRVRLVKGIWQEPAAVAYTDYETIRGNYARLLEELLGGGAFVAIASHDEWIHWRALELIDREGLARDAYEFQMLLGVRPHLGDALLGDGHTVRVYVPYGADWYEYSVRRFQENPQLAHHVVTDVLSRARRRVRREPERFAGKVVVVTGAGHGIGRASEARFAAEGAEAVVVDVNADGARETVSLIGAAGGRAHAIVADVSDEGAVESLRDQIAEAHKHVDVLHNNAGRLRAGSVTELSAEEWDLTFAVNVRSMFLVCRALIPLMQPNGGAIVNTASSSGLVGEAMTPAYNASKAAIINLTRQLAADYARTGIRANCVCPGWVPTGFNDPVLAV